ncbi:hypothetical protein D3C81_1414750 [compost metagenome]
MNGFAVKDHSDSDERQRQHSGKRQLPADQETHGQQHDGKKNRRIDECKHPEAHGCRDSSDIVSGAGHQVTGPVAFKERRGHGHQMIHEAGAQQTLYQVGPSEQLVHPYVGDPIDYQQHEHNHANVLHQ